jgi:hypothetical protein
MIADPDKYEIGNFASWDLGLAKNFVSGNFPYLMIAPLKDPEHVGEFPI